MKISMCRCFAFAAAVALCELSADADSLSVRMLPGEHWWGMCNSFGTTASRILFAFLQIATKE